MRKSRKTGGTHGADGSEAADDEGPEETADEGSKKTAVETADIELHETFGEILSKINTRLQSGSPNETEDEKLRNEIKALSETGKASCRGKFGLRSFMDNKEFRECEAQKARYYFAIAFALFTQRDLYDNVDELFNIIVKFFEKGRVHFNNASTNLETPLEKIVYHNELLFVGFYYANEKLTNYSNLEGYYRILSFFFINRSNISIKRGELSDNVISKLIQNKEKLEGTLTELKNLYKTRYPDSKQTDYEMIRESEINRPLYNAIISQSGGKRRTRKGKSRKTRRR